MGFTMDSWLKRISDQGKVEKWWEYVNCEEENKQLVLQELVDSVSVHSGKQEPVAGTAQSVANNDGNKAEFKSMCIWMFSKQACRRIILKNPGV